MLSSPLRTCLLMSRTLPVGKSSWLQFTFVCLSRDFSDFLIRLSPMRVPPPFIEREMLALLPDKLEHPRFKNRKSGRAIYIICWKRALVQLVNKGVTLCAPVSHTADLLCRYLQTDKRKTLLACVVGTTHQPSLTSPSATRIATYGRSTPNATSKLKRIFCPQTIDSRRI